MSRVFGRRASHQEDSTEQAASHQAAPASAAAVHAPSRRERAASLSARLNMFIRPDSSRRPSAEHASEMDGQVPEEIA